jgi:hypothetical protein
MRIGERKGAGDKIVATKRSTRRIFRRMKRRRRRRKRETRNQDTIQSAARVTSLCFLFLSLLPIISFISMFHYQ